MNEIVAAVRIQRTWRRYRNSQKWKILSASLSTTQERLRMLEKYRQQLSLVHPSRIHRWEVDRLHSAAQCIQKWWRNNSKRNVRTEQIRTTHVRTQEPRQVKVDTDKIADKILLRMTKMEYVDFEALDVALMGYYKARRHHSSGIAEPALEIDAIEGVLANWDSNSFSPLVNYGHSSAHDAMLKQAATPWWHRIPDQDSDELDEWLNEIEEGIQAT